MELKAHYGSEIWVGRGAKHNDAMTFRHARGHDIWLHARDAAGAHVILRRSSNSEVHPEALIDAAVLAKYGHFGVLNRPHSVVEFFKNPELKM